MTTQTKESKVQIAERYLKAFIDFMGSLIKLYFILWSIAGVVIGFCLFPTAVEYVLTGHQTSFHPCRVDKDVDNN